MLTRGTFSLDTSGNDSTEESPLDELPDFTLDNADVEFHPEYYPEKIKPGKERNLSREEGLCEGEHVEDTGSKNVEIHIRGYLLGREKDTFWDLLANGGEFRMVAMPWSGDVYVESGDLRGPLGVDNVENDWVYEYTLDVVEATGEGMEDDGIVDGPGSNPQANNDAGHIGPGNLL